MEETMDPGTGLPVGAQPSPVGAYDFTPAFQSIQGMLDKIAQGQANRAAQKVKDAKAWKESELQDPGVWAEDDPYIQDALMEYDKYRRDQVTPYGYDESKYPNDVKAELRRLEGNLKRKTNEAKANEEYLKEVRKKINDNPGNLFDTGWGEEWVNNFLSQNTEERNRIRKSTSDEDNPYQKIFTLDDVVQKYQVYDTKDGKKDVDINEIEKRVLAGASAKGGVGRRMYILNRLNELETPEQFAKRVAEISPSMLGEMEARKQKPKGTDDDGFNTMSVQAKFYKKDSGPAAAYADQSVPLNSVHYVKKGATTPTVNIGEGSLQQQVSMAYITKGANNKYYLFGTRTGALSPLSDPIELTQDDIQTIDAQLGVNVVEDIERAIRGEKWAGSKKQ